MLDVSSHTGQISRRQTMEKLGSNPTRSFNRRRWFRRRSLSAPIGPYCEINSIRFPHGSRTWHRVVPATSKSSRT